MNNIDSRQFDPHMSYQNDKLYRDIYVPNKMPDFSTLPSSLGDFVVQNKNLQTGQEGFKLVSKELEKEPKEVNRLQKRIRKNVLRDIPNLTMKRFFK